MRPCATSVWLTWDGVWGATHTQTHTHTHTNRYIHVNVRGGKRIHVTKEYTKSIPVATHLSCRENVGSYAPKQALLCEKKKRLAYRLEKNAPKQYLLQHIRLFESMRLQYLCHYARVYASYGHMAWHTHTHSYATHSGVSLDPEVLLPDDALRVPQAVSEKHHVGAVH